MRKVPADADALGVAFRCGTVATSVMVAEFDLAMNVVANRLHTLPAAIDTAEQRPCEIAKLLRVAVAASQQIHQRFIGQGAHVPLCAFKKTSSGRPVSAMMNSLRISNTPGGATSRVQTLPNASW